MNGSVDITTPRSFSTWWKIDSPLQTHKFTGFHQTAQWFISFRIMDDVLLEKARKGDLQYFTERRHEVEHMCHLCDTDGRTLLHNAVTSGNTELVELFILNGASNCVNSQDEEGWSPLHTATSLGDSRLVEVLLKHGASPDSRTSAGRTPLHYAASKGRTDIVRILWEQGAALDVRDEVGWTPLHRAANSGKLPVVKLLIDEAKVNIEILDKEKQSPLDVALESQHESVVLFLVSRGAEIKESTLDKIPVKLLQAMKDAKEGRLDLDDF